MWDAESITLTFVSLFEAPTLNYNIEKLAKKDLKLIKFIIIDETSEKVEGSYILSLLTELNFPAINKLKLNGFLFKHLKEIFKADSKYLNNVTSLSIKDFVGDFNWFNFLNKNLNKKVSLLF